MPYTEEQLEGLTDEERNALTLDDEGDGAADDGDAGDPDDATDQDADDGASEADAGADADAGTGDADAAAAAAADAAAQAAVEAADAAAAKQPKEPAPSAPLLVIEPPADADAKLAAIATRKGEIAQQFDDGDITAKEFQKLLDAENRAEREIERQLDAAEMARTMEDQRVQREWVSDCNAFVAAHPEYADQASEPFKLLNEAILAIARMPVNAGLSNTKALAKAHRIVQAELGEAAPAPAAAPAAGKKPQQVIPRPAAPPNIGNLPAAVIPDTSSGEFAHLDRLQSRDPDAYEDAILKLTPAARERYLRA